MRQLRKVETDYYEVIDDEGERRIKVVTTTTTWFADSDAGTRHNPTVSTETYFL